MTQFLLVVAAGLTVGAIVFGITVLVTGDEEGLRPVEPDGRATPLAGDRPLVESDLTEVRFDTALRGYRMVQVDAALKRAAYDVGYKDELIKVLQAEVDALRDGRKLDAEVLRRAREAALEPVRQAGSGTSTSLATEPVAVRSQPERPLVAEPESESEPESVPQPESVPEPEAGAEPEPTVASELEDAAVSEPEPEPEQEPEQETEPGEQPATVTGTR